jgi:hypothetical protein
MLMILKTAFCVCLQIAARLKPSQDADAAPGSGVREHGENPFAIENDGLKGRPPGASLLTEQA